MSTSRATQCNGSSSIGLKMLMAVSGLLLVGFLVAHLAGNLLIFAGPEALNAYAKKLRDIMPVLWFLRIGLLVTAAVHIYTSIRLTLANRAARPVAYQSRKFVRTTTASRTMMLSGSVVLAFILYHLAHLTFRMTSPELQALGHFEVYQMMILTFRSPFVSGFYCLSIVLLMLHLNHGASSFLQSLGLHHSRWQKYFLCIGPVLSIVLGLGFLSIPLAVFLNLVG